MTLLPVIGVCHLTFLDEDGNKHNDEDDNNDDTENTDGHDSAAGVFLLLRPSQDVSIVLIV